MFTMDAKLDWVFTNEAWADIFDSCFASFHTNGASDRCFMLLKCICPDDSGIRLFKFFNLWIEHSSYKNLVNTVWSSMAQGSVMQQVAFKLYKMRKNLSKFNKEEIGDVEINFRKAEQEISNIQSLLQDNPNSVDLNLKEKLAVSNYHFSTYENFLQQKSKVARVSFMHLSKVENYRIEFFLSLIRVFVLTILIR